MVCGMHTADGGSISVDGAALEGNRLGLRCGVSALLDQSGLYPRLTARENIRFFGRLRGLSSADLEARVEAVVSLFGLDRIADRRTAGFSQGERMKVALGRAVVHSPRNLLLDEPTNGLDIPSVRALRALLQEMRDRGACIVLSSHLTEEVRALCDHVVVISHGALVAEGRPQDLCRQTDSASLEDAFVKLTTPAEAVACPTTH
jgi:sodium transport system ATP-binding protein